MKFYVIVSYFGCYLIYWSLGVWCMVCKIKLPIISQFSSIIIHAFWSFSSWSWLHILVWCRKGHQNYHHHRPHCNMFANRGGRSPRAGFVSSFSSKSAASGQAPSRRNWICFDHDFKDGACEQANDGASSFLFWWSLFEWWWYKPWRWGSRADNYQPSSLKPFLKTGLNSPPPFNCQTLLWNIVIKILFCDHIMW